MRNAEVHSPPEPSTYPTICPTLYTIQPSQPFSPLYALDLAHRDHLLAQVILVLSNRSVPPPDRLVLAHHDVFCDFVE